MPRKIAPALPNTISRLLQGSYLKTAPRVHQVLLDHPPPVLPPRAALPRPASAQDLRLTPRPTRKAAQRSLPAHLKLAPRPISYLADNVRRRFFEDHPWERARVVTLTEGKELTSSLGEANARRAAQQGLEVDLSLWGSNPTAEDVVSCTLYQHRHEEISLSVAYHHTLSSFYSLRAQHEHATRAAVLEARAYGASFDPTPETTRAFKHAEAALGAGAAHISGPTANAEATFVQPGSRPRIKPTDASWTAGEDYLRIALATRDGAPVVELTKAPKESEPEQVHLSDLESLLSGSRAGEAKQPSIPLDLDALVGGTPEGTLSTAASSNSLPGSAKVEADEADEPEQDVSEGDELEQVGIEEKHRRRLARSAKEE